MNRLALTTLALALTAAGSASAFQDSYGNSNDGYRDNNGVYHGPDSHYYNDGSRSSGPRSDYAQVLHVERVGDRYGNRYGSNLRQQCWNEQTNDYEDGYYRDGSGRLYRGDGHNNAGGTLLGAIIGGALGNQVGKGDGRKAATIGGAVIGGAIGNNVARNNDRNDNYDQYRDNSGVVRRCRTVSDNSGYQGASGYNVTYRYGGQTYRSMLNYNPGRTMRVTVDVRPQEGNIAYSR